MRIIQMNAGGFIAFCMLLIGFVALPVVASGMQSTSAIQTAAPPEAYRDLRESITAALR